MLLGDTATALAEFARVLKPGGWLGAVVPCSSDGLAGRLGAAVGRVAGGRMFGADEIPGLVEALDFDRVRSQTTNGLISTTYARKSPDL
jgi:arsenite methyltransferase